MRNLTDSAKHGHARTHAICEHAETLAFAALRKVRSWKRDGYSRRSPGTGQPAPMPNGLAIKAIDFVSAALLRLHIIFSLHAKELVC